MKSHRVSVSRSNGVRVSKSIMSSRTYWAMFSRTFTSAGSSESSRRFQSFSVLKPYSFAY